MCRVYNSLNEKTIHFAKHLTLTWLPHLAPQSQIPCRGNRLHGPVFPQRRLAVGRTENQIGNPITRFLVAILAGIVDCHIYIVEHHRRCCGRLRMAQSVRLESMGPTTKQKFQHVIRYVYVGLVWVFVFIWRVRRG